MSISRSLVALAGVAILGIGVVGVGAGATFTDAVNATQSITAGKMVVHIGSESGTTSADGRTLTLAPTGPQSSTFTTTPQHVDIINTGNIAATEVQLSVTAKTNGAAGMVLRDELYVKIVSSNATFYNGLLSNLLGELPYELGNGALPDSFDVTFYAGGPEQTDGTDGRGSALKSFTPNSLTNGAQGGIVTPKITITVEG